MGLITANGNIFSTNPFDPIPSLISLAEAIYYIYNHSDILETHRRLRAYYDEESDIAFLLYYDFKKGCFAWVLLSPKINDDFKPMVMLLKADIIYMIEEKKTSEELLTYIFTSRAVRYGSNDPTQLHNEIHKDFLNYGNDKLITENINSISAERFSVLIDKAKEGRI